MTFIPEPLTVQSLSNELNHKHLRTFNELLTTIGDVKMEKMFGTFLHKGELALWGGDTGNGKSTLAIDLTDKATKGTSFLEQSNECNPVTAIYYNFELSDCQLKDRYGNFDFSDRFIMPNVTELFLQNDGVFKIDTIIEDLNATNSELIVIDNITAISSKNTADGDTALALMKNLKMLNMKFGTTIIVLCHVPKMPSNAELTINHIAGSKHLVNFADNVSIIGKDSRDIRQRYLKQLKSRNAEPYQKVLTFDIEKGDCLHTDFVGFSEETEHLILNDSKENKYIDIVSNVFGSRGINYGDFCNIYSEKYSQTVENAKKIHAKLKSRELITKIDGLWYANQNEYKF